MRSKKYVTLYKVESATGTVAEVIAEDRPKTYKLVKSYLGIYYSVINKERAGVEGFFKTPQEAVKGFAKKLARTVSACQRRYSMAVKTYEDFLESEIKITKGRTGYLAEKNEVLGDLKVSDHV